MNATKIHLSSEEMQLVSNAELLLTKNRIIEKVYLLFGELSEQVKVLVSLLPQELQTTSPKISKGEKYQQLPYVILDYPRIFGKEDVFAIRTFFWWGNFFSVSIHLKGKYQKLYAGALQKQSVLLSEFDFRVCINGNEWDHDMREEDYESVTAYSDPESINKLIHQPFYKLSARVAFNRWDEMNEILFRLHQVIYKAIGY